MRLTTGTLLVLLLVAAFLVWKGLFAPPPPRPMFHNRLGDAKQWIGKTWYPDVPFRDRGGNFGFADFELNLFVVISTGDAEYDGKYFPESTPSTATLLAQSRYETQVQRVTDVLIVVDRDGQWFEADIAPRVARTWSREFEMHNWNSDSNLLCEVVARLGDFDARNRLKTFLGKAMTGHQARPP